MKNITYYLCSLLLFIMASPETSRAQVSNPSNCPENLAIPDDGCPTLTSYAITVTGLSGTQLGTDIEVTDVGIIISHSWDNDLEINLTSPNGVIVELSTDNGANGQNYGDPATCEVTNFNMGAVISITAVMGPFIGSFLPEGDFADYNDGSDPNGTWMLEVCDNAAGDIGELEFVEISFAPPLACPNPSGLSVTNITGTGADLTWTPGGSCTVDAEYWVQASGGAVPTPGTGTSVDCAPTFPIGATGLVGEIEYEVYVDEDCGAGNTSGVTLLGSFTTLVSCSDPSGLVVNNITTGSADITWTPGGSCTVDAGYWVQMVGLGVPATSTGTSVGCSPTFPINVSGILGGTAYEVFVEEDCGVGGLSGVTSLGTFSSQTLVSNFPACENFDGMSNCIANCTNTCPLGNGFTNLTTDDGDWSVDNLRTGSESTGPNNDLTGGGNYLYIEASGCFNLNFIMTTPWYDISSGLTTPHLSFWYHKHGVAMGDLTVEVEDPAGSGNYTLVTSIIGETHPDQTDPWLESANNLSVTGPNISFRFTGVTGADFTSDMAIDEICVKEAPTCAAPTGFSVSDITADGADLTWVPGGDCSVDAEYWVQASGGPAPNASTGTLVGCSPAFPISVSGLTSGTAYDVWVNEDCGANGTTGPVLTGSFTSLLVVSNPSACQLGAAVTDNSCSTNDIFQIDVTSAPGSALGTDVILIGVNLIIEHTWVGDLDIKLVSPSGMQTDLSIGNGGGGLNYGDPTDATCTLVTNFNMNGADGSVTGGSAPFIGSYFPEGNFADFNDGSNPVGLWELSVCDNAIDDVGELEYIELVFDMLPACPNPTSLVVTNITTSGADIEWTPAGSCTADASYWVLPEGDPAPGAGTGTSVGCTPGFPIAVSGLGILSAYDVWVYEDCGTGTAGPVNLGSFTTMGGGTVACPDPLNQTFCYDNNDKTSWLFTSSSGTGSMNLTFNAGGIEAGHDFISIHDGADNTAPILFQGDYGGDLSGVSVTGHGLNMYMELSSDGAVSCTQGSYCCSTLWDWEVTCLPCAQPTATFTEVDDCGNQQFFVDVNITDLGSATTVDITNDGAAPTVPASGLGVYTVGPFASLSVVDITLVHDVEPTCDLVSTGHTFICQPLNDDCANAEGLTVGTNSSCPAAATTGTTINATIDIGVSCDPAGNLGVWYSFEAPANGEVNILVGGLSGNLEAALFDACGGTEVFCDNTPNNEIVTGLTPDSTYFLFIWSDNGSQGNFTVCVQETAGPPTNDECVNATAIGVDLDGTDCTAPNSGTNLQATDSAPTNGTPACNSYAGGDIWYTFTAPIGGTVNLIVTTNDWSTVGAAIYDDCSATVELDCNGLSGTGTFQLMDMTAGIQYWLRLWDEDNDDFGTIEFCLEAICPAPNGLVVSNITQTTAGLIWTPGGGCSVDMEYWVLPQFDPQPVPGTGTPTGCTPTFPIALSGLTPISFYDVWVYEDCGSTGTNGPDHLGSFVTLAPPAGNPSSCQLGLPISDDNCPTDDIFQIDVTSAPGTMLGTDVIVTDVEIIVEHTWVAELEIKLVSPNGVEVALSSHNCGSGDNYGNPNDAGCTQVTNFNMQGTDGPITGGSAPFIGSFVPEGDFADYNDGSSPIGIWELRICDKGNGDMGELEFVEIKFNACVPPTATFAVVDDCVANNQFFVDVNITDLGTAVSVDITNDGGAPTVPAVGIGTHTVGPFVSGTAVAITLVHDSDPDCNVSSSHSFNCPPPNDECANAIPVTVNETGTGCSSPTVGTNIGATDSAPTNSAPTCINFEGGDIWYSFTVPPNGEIEVIVSVNNWSTFSAAVYDDCASMTELVCGGIFGTGTFTLSGLVGGATNYLRLWDFDNNDPGTVEFCLEGSLPTSISCIYTADLNDNPSSGVQIIAVSDTLTSTAVISGTADVQYFAGESILLEAGFQADIGTQFLAEIQACMATCSDGLQNGDETDVDCGGNSCPACGGATCSDGLQNGNETGVDCGGGICDPCPTCSDGLQNGDETGIDCGGSCPACPAPCLVTQVSNDTASFGNFLYNVTDTLASAVNLSATVDVEYRTGKPIFLKPGFIGSAGIQILAGIATCQMNLSGPPGEEEVEAFIAQFQKGTAENSAGPNKSLGQSFILMYPDPTNNELHIQIKTERFQPVEITVQNALGSVPHQSREEIFSSISQTVLDVSNYPPGLYWLRIRFLVDGDWQVVQFVKGL